MQPGKNHNNANQRKGASETDVDLALDQILSESKQSKHDKSEQSIPEPREFDVDAALDEILGLAKPKPPKQPSEFDPSTIDAALDEILLGPEKDRIIVKTPKSLDQDVYHTLIVNLSQQLQHTQDIRARQIDVYRAVIFSLGQQLLHTKHNLLQQASEIERAKQQHTAQEAEFVRRAQYFEKVERDFHVAHDVILKELGLRFVLPEYPQPIGTASTPVPPVLAPLPTTISVPESKSAPTSGCKPTPGAVIEPQVRQEAETAPTSEAEIPRQPAVSDVRSAPTSEYIKMLDEFLNEVREQVQRKDSARLQGLLLVEPPLPPTYHQVISDLRVKHPKGNDSNLSRLCDDIAPQHPEGGSSWGAFGEVMRRYLVFLRDFDQNNYLNIFNSLKSLLNQCNTALGDTTYGVVILPTVLYLTRVLARFAVTLDKNPDIVAQQQQGQNQSNEDTAGAKVTFVENSANVVRDVFIKCINDKSGTSGLAGPGRRGRPENKRIGIYQTANFCLKLLFRCRNLRNAEQMFVSIDNQSPPLSFYPASQRVTYLYYLGRYHFANNHFYRAQLALQEAYNTCHREAFKQRHLILIYLITSNICLGRFPSHALLARPEASGLADYFIPICQLITKGDIVAFRRALDVQNPQAEWFLRHRILLQLRDRCEVLVWRSLARRVFIVSGYNAQDGRGMPFLRLSHVQAAVRWLHHRQQHSSFPTSITTPVHDEFVGIAEAAAEAGFDLDSGAYVNGGVSGETHHHDLNGVNGTDSSSDLSNITIAELESILSSLIAQGLLGGFITHDNPRFAIPGAKIRGALATGFPPIWQTIEAKADPDVPGWVQEEKTAPAGGLGPGGIGGMGGRVVNLSGARPAGAGP